MINMQELERLMQKFGDYPMLLANDSYFHPLNDLPVNPFSDLKPLKEIDFTDKELSLGVIDVDLGDRSFFTSESSYQHEYTDDPKNYGYQIYWFQIID